MPLCDSVTGHDIITSRKLVLCSLNSKQKFKWQLPPLPQSHLKGNSPLGVQVQEIPGWLTQSHLKEKVPVKRLLCKLGQPLPAC